MIYFIPSHNIHEDSQILLNMMPEVYYKESFDEWKNINEEVKKKQNISHIIMKRHDVDSEAIFLVQKSFDSVNENEVESKFKSFSANNLPSACISIPNIYFESVLKVAKKNYKSENDVRSAVIKLPGGSNILFLSKTESSSSQLKLSLFTKHIVENILPPYDGKCNENETLSHDRKSITRTSSLTSHRKKENISQICNDKINKLKADDRSTPYFQSLTVKALQNNNNKETKFSELLPNSIHATNIETEILSGKLMLILRTQDPNDDLYFHERIFKGRGRRVRICLRTITFFITTTTDLFQI